MLYAVAIEPLNAVYFVSERSDDNPWDVEDSRNSPASWGDRGDLE